MKTTKLPHCLFVAAVALSLSACVETLSSINRTLEGLNAPSSSDSGGFGRGPGPSPAQMQKINGAFKKGNSGEIQRAINEAMPNIKKLVALASCQWGRFLTDDRHLKGLGPILHPEHGWMDAPAFSYAPKGKCVDVIRISEWSMPAKNVLKFKVMYYSEDAGETTICKGEMTKEEGVWLVSFHG